MEPLSFVCVDSCKMEALLASLSKQLRLNKTRGMKSTVSTDLFGLDLYTLLPVAQFSFEYAVEIFGGFS